MMPPSKHDIVISPTSATAFDDDSCDDVEMAPLVLSLSQDLSIPEGSDHNAKKSQQQLHHLHHQQQPYVALTPPNIAGSPSGKIYPSNSNASADAMSHSKPAVNNHIKAIMACTLYSFCSVSMILVNKSLASSYSHVTQGRGDLNILVVVFQAFTAVVCVSLCKALGWVEYPPLTLRTAASWAPVNVFFCWMLFTGMKSLQTNSVPMVTVFKNVTNITTTAGDWFFFGNSAEALVVVAFGIMLGGAVAAAKNDIEITMLGLLWMVANCLGTSGYVLYMKHATQSIKLSTFGMVYVNNVLCIAFLLPVAIFMGEAKLFLQTPGLHTADYLMKNAFAGLVGFFLNFASLHCVATTGPTTYAIVGSLNKVPVAILGWILFDNVITAQTWFFISISMCGGFLYSYAKIASSKRASRID